MVEVRHRTIPVNGIRMHVAEQGDGPLVLLCHGFPETWYSWRHQMSALADAGYRAVAPDLRGYGGTDRPTDADQYTLLHLVGDAVALLDALEATNAVIVGNDWGATLAWQAALMRPDRFRAVVGMGVPMMGQPPRPPTELFPRTEDALLYVLYFQIPGLAEEEFERDVGITLRKLLFSASGDAGARGPGHDTPNPFGMVSLEAGLLAPLPTPQSLPPWLTNEDIDHLTAVFKAGGFRGGLNYYRNLDRNRELLAGFRGMRIEVPAMYLVGERDPGLSIPGMRQIIDSMPELVPGLTHSEILEGAGHWIQQEKAPEVNARLVSFLRSLPR